MTDIVQGSLSEPLRCVRVACEAILGLDDRGHSSGGIAAAIAGLDER